MLNLFGPEVVTFFEIHEGMLVVLSKRPKQADSKHTLRIRLLDHEARQVDIPVTVVSSRPGPSGRGYRVTASVNLDSFYHRQLEDLLYSYAVRPDLGEAGRRSLRQNLCLQAESSELPGGRGFTCDVSRHGMRLQCDGPVEQGTALNLELHTEMAGLPRISLQGRVLSSSWNESRQAHELGIDLVGSSPAQLDILDYYLRSQLPAALSFAS